MLQTCPEATGTPWPVLAFAEEPEYVPIDANGDLTGDGAKSYEWDAENRLTAINQGTQRSEFKYDGLGRRVEIIERDNCSAGTCTTLSSDKKYLWVGRSIAEERDSTGATTTKRYFGQGFQQGSSTYFYTQDHLGSIREVVDSTGAVRARYDYDPYGRRTKISGDIDADFGYAGYLEHAPSGLKLTLYRAYDPTLGRWLSRDPIGLRGGVNLYAYVDGDPVNYIDPLGLECKPPRFRQHTTNGWDADVGNVLFLLEPLSPFGAKFWPNEGTKAFYKNAVDDWAWHDGDLYTGTVDPTGLATNAAAFQAYKATLAAEELASAQAVGSALKNDVAHSLPFWNRARASEACFFKFQGGDGQWKHLLQLEYDENGFKGIIEWVIDEVGNLTHEFFQKNGTITGEPNMTPSKLNNLK